MTQADANHEDAHADFLHSAECLHVDITWLTETTFSAGVMLSQDRTTRDQYGDRDDPAQHEYEAIGTLIRGVLEIDALPRIEGEVRAAIIEGLCGGDE